MRRTFVVAIVASLLTIGCNHEAPTPSGDLQGAAAASDGETIWIAGGTTVSDAVWQEFTADSVDPSASAYEAATRGWNDLALQYGADGTLHQTIDLGDLADPPGDGCVQQQPSLTAGSVRAGTVLATAICQTKVDGRQGLYEPLVIAVADGEATRITVDGPALHTDTAAFEEPDVRVVGTIRDEVLVAVGPKPLVVGEHSAPVALLAVDPARAVARPISLPEGVRFTEGVCVHEDAIFVVTANIGFFGVNTIRAGTIATEDGSGFEPIEISPSGPATWQIAAACLPGGPVVMAQTSRPQQHQLSDRVTLEEVDLGNRSVRETASPASRMADAPMRVLDDSVLLVGFYPKTTLRRWSGGQWTGSPVGFTEGDGGQLAVGAALVDVTGLLTHRPDGRDGPAPTSVPTP